MREPFVTFERNARGFCVGRFVDRYGRACHVQDSGLATEDAIWLGTDDADPKVLVNGLGWVDVPFPRDTLFHTVMHLTRDQVRELLPVLVRFVETGSVAPGEDERRVLDALPSPEAVLRAQGREAGEAAAERVLSAFREEIGRERGEA